MPLTTKQTLIDEMAPPLEKAMALALIDEFMSLERRFIQRDWEPAELDGGQFSEILSRLLYYVDSGNLSYTKDFKECCGHIENDQAFHAHQPRQDLLHLVKVLRTIYKFRSQRGAVHISPTYSPNHMDSKLIVENVRWAFAETLRLFWKGDRESVAKAIRELLQFDVPVIGRFEDVIMVQRTDLSADEEILVLLHYAGEQGFSRSELGKYSQITSPAVTKSVQKLSSPTFREVVQMVSGRYRLTDLGSKRVREQLAEKLLLQ